MGQRSTGIPPRRGFLLDANSILVGYVGPRARQKPSETRTGTALLLTTRLEAQDAYRVIGIGQASNSAGGYIIEAAHVPEGGTLSDAVGWAPIATITLSAGGVNEVPISGVNVRALVKAAGSLTGDVRVAAVRATAGTGTGSGGNGVAVPAGTNTIALEPLSTVMA